VCNEESCCLINPDPACHFSHSRGAAAEEGLSDRVSSGRQLTSEYTRSEAFRLALRALGYIEGQNIAIEYRYAGVKLDRYPETAAELVRLKVDIIVAAGTDRTVRAGKNATKTSRRSSVLLSSSRDFALPKYTCIVLSGRVFPSRYIC